MTESCSITQHLYDLLKQEKKKFAERIKTLKIMKIAIVTTGKG